MLKILKFEDFTLSLLERQSSTDFEDLSSNRLRIFFWENIVDSFGKVSS